MAKAETKVVTISFEVVADAPLYKRAISLGDSVDRALDDCLDTEDTQDPCVMAAGEDWLTKYVKHFVLTGEE